MVQQWPTLLTFIAPVLFFCRVHAQLGNTTFVNTAVVRTIDLGGSTTHVTTSYQFKSLKPNSKKYYFALSSQDEQRTTWMEAKFKGASESLKVEKAEGASQK